MDEELVGLLDEAEAAGVFDRDPELRSLANQYLAKHGIDSPEVAGRKRANEAAERKRVADLNAHVAQQRARGRMGFDINDALAEQDAPDPSKGDRTFGEEFARRTTDPAARALSGGAIQVLDQATRGGDATLSLATGQPERAWKIISTPGESIATTSGEGRFERASGETLTAFNPLNLLNLLTLGEGGTAVKAGKEAAMTAAERASAAQGFELQRAQALTELRILRSQKKAARASARELAALDGILQRVEGAPSAGELAAAMRSDEAVEALRVLSGKADEVGEALQGMEEGRLRRGPLGGGPVPPEVPPSIIDPGAPGPVPRGTVELPPAADILDRKAAERAAATAEAEALVGANEARAARLVPGERVAIREGLDAGKEGRITGVQPNGNLLVSVNGGRPALMDASMVEPTTRGVRVPDPVPATVNDPIGTYPLTAPAEAGLSVPPRARGGPPALVPPDGPSPLPGAAGGAPAPLPAVAANASLPMPAWTAAVDAAAGGVGSWLDARFPGVMLALREGTAKTPYHAADREVGALYETYLSNRQNLRGEAADRLLPAERALKGVAVTADESDDFFRFASSRSDTVPAVVRDHPEVGEALDWYNRVLRPRLVEKGALSAEALGEFDRYLPNILTAHLDSPGTRRGIVRAGSPRTSAPRLRMNHPGAVLENVSKEEAQALADSLAGTTSKPVVVGPYGKNAYVKYASPEDRDAFLKLLDAERRGAGLRSGKIRYRAFDAIPDEWLERAVEEGGGGLIKDPMGLLAHAMNRGADEVAAREFYEGLARLDGVRDLPTGAAPDVGMAAIPNTPRWGALAGKQVPEALHKALTQTEATDTHLLGRWWRGMIRAFKKNVILQSATASRNAIYDAGTLAVYNRMTPGSPDYWRSLKVAADSFREWKKSGVRPEAIKRFMESGGLLNGDPLTSESLDRINEIIQASRQGKLTTEQAAEEFIHLTTGSPLALQRAEDPKGLLAAGRSAAGGASAAAKAALMGEDAATIATRAATGAGQNAALGAAMQSGERLYQATDDYFKIAYFDNWVRVIRKESPDLPLPEVYRRAAAEVNARSQIAAFKSPIAKAATDSGILPFAWWWDQKVRIETYMATRDPVRFAIAQAQGSAMKAVGAAAVATATGIPAKLLWDWMKRNPGQIPVGAEKDKNGEWVVVGANYQAAVPDPVAAAWAAAQKSAGENARDVYDTLAFSNPVTATLTKAGAIAHSDTNAKDPTFGEDRPLLEPGETTEAALLRAYQQSFGSPLGPTGRQSEDVRALAEGDEFRGRTQPRTVGRTLSGLAGASITESPAGGNLPARIYTGRVRDAEDWMRYAMRDPDRKNLPPGDPERARIRREYESRVLDAFEDAIEDGAKPPPPVMQTEQGAARLRSILEGR